MMCLFICRFLPFWLMQTGDFGFAMSHCFNSFRFDELCPDPRFSSLGDLGKTTYTSNLSPDTIIALSSNNSYYQSRGYGFTSKTSMNTKDHATQSCEFQNSGVEFVETATVKLVHVTDTPWHFRQADSCSHIVKFNYDAPENFADRSFVGEETKVCHKELGFRRPGSQDQKENEYQAEKDKVYFWHNLTLRTHSVEFEDTITNYQWSKEDIRCAENTNKSRYVQIGVEISKMGNCEIIVQQYKISGNRSQQDCTRTIFLMPLPIQFCGSYDCSQITVLLTSLKLHSRYEKIIHKPTWNNKNLFKCRTELPDATKPDQERTICIIADKVPDEDAPLDWVGIVVRCAFVIAGVVLIFCVLSCLYSKTGNLAAL